MVVLVVERREEVRHAIAAALREDGHEAIELSDGFQLLARLTSPVALGGAGRESLVIVADANGTVLDVLRMLRSGCWRTPVVLLDEDVATSAARELDALATTSRPLDLGRLRRLVHQAPAHAARA